MTITMTMIMKMTLIIGYYYAVEQRLAGLVWTCNNQRCNYANYLEQFCKQNTANNI